MKFVILNLFQNPAKLIFNHYENLKQVQVDMSFNF
jgi:hypothetical protein